MAGVTLEKSLEAYQSKTNTNLSDVIGSKAFPEDLTKFKRQILKANAEFHNQQGASIWPSVARILGPFQTLGTVTSSAVSLTPFAPAALILGATLHLVNVTRQVIEAYGSIGDILEQIADIVDRLKIHSEAGVMREELRVLIQKMMGVIVEVLGLASKRIGEERGKRGITKEFFQRALLGEKSAVEKKMAVLRELVEKEGPLVLALVGKGIQGIASTMDRDRLESRLEKVFRGEILTAMKNHHDQIQSSSKDWLDTDWLVDEPEVQSWMALRPQKSKSALIWIKGEQGTGKSHIASHLIRTLFKEDRSITTYFYVQSRKNGENLASSIFTCIALQLIKKSKSFKDIAIEALNNTDLNWNTETIWKKLFVSFLKDERRWRTFIVIDGLDAADPKEQDIVLSKLESLQQSTFKGKSRFHIAIFARPSLSSTHNIWTSKDTIFQIPEDKIQTHVTNFIETKLSNLTVFKKLTTENQSQRIVHLSKEVKSDFALAGLVVTQAQAYRNSERELMGFLDRPISRNIGHHVRDILSQTDSSIYHKLNWITTLRWIACAYRVLTLDEALFIRNADLNDDDLTLPKRISSREFKSENQSTLAFTSQNSGSQNELDVVELKTGMMRDYLVQEDNEMIGDLDATYAIHKSQAHARVAEICLRRLLANDDRRRKTLRADIMPYAADHVIDHIRAVRKDGVLDPGEKTQLASKVRLLLGSPSAIQCWYNAVSKEGRLGIIKLLLHDDEVLERINQWDPESSLSAHTLYTPFAQLCNRSWIQGANMDTQFCLLFLHHYNSLDLPSDKRPGEIPIEIAELKGERILHLADKALDDDSEMIRDSNWHLRIADALMEANHLKEAREEYECAETDPANWMAKYKLALVFAAEDDISKAIRKAEEALSCSSQPDELSKSNIYLSLSTWQTARGKTHDALDAAKQAYELDSTDFQKIANYFLALRRAKKWRSILDLSDKLHYTKSTPSTMTLLLLGWEEGHDLLIEAVGTYKKYRDLAEDIFSSLVQMAKEQDDLSGSVWEEFQRGLFYFHHTPDDEEHLRIWEALPLQHDSKATEKFAQQLQCRALADIYYQNALRSNSKETKKEWVSKLESLAGVASKESTPKSDMEEKADAAMILGRWRRQEENIKSNELRALFRPRICQGIRILEDDDPLNDSDGYAILARSLLCAGDSNDALRAFAAGMLPLATSLQWTKESKDTRDSQIRQAIKSMPVPFQCHGKHDCEPEQWLAFYVCKQCLDKSFCVTCLTGSSSRVCDKSHQMLQVYLKGREIGKPMAKFQGSLLEVDQKWLKKLKEKWDITDETTATSSLPTLDIVLASREKRKSTS